MLFASCFFNRNDLSLFLKKKKKQEEQLGDTQIDDVLRQFIEIFNIFILNDKSKILLRIKVFGPKTLD